MSDRSVVLVLGGGGARGLAHLGVIEVLEAEGIRADALAGTSIGGLIAALVARGLSTSRIAQIASGFRLPRRFLPGRVFEWDDIFRTAVPLLAGLSFADLERPLAVSAVDLLTAEEVVLNSGPVLPAIRATCAMPGVLAPEPLGKRKLVDGGVVNVLPVDLAWMWEPDTVIAVNIVAKPGLAAAARFGIDRLTSALGRLFPTVLSARSAYLVALRAVDVALARQRSLALAMTCPEVVIDVDVGHVAVEDFHRLADVIDLGRQAGRAALPRIREALEGGAITGGRLVSGDAKFIDPVCHMIVSPGRARAMLVRDGVSYYFCSTNCRDLFARHGAREAPPGPTGSSPHGTGGGPRRW